MKRQGDIGDTPFTYSSFLGEQRPCTFRWRPREMSEALQSPQHPQVIERVRRVVVVAGDPVFVTVRAVITNTCPTYTSRFLINKTQGGRDGNENYVGSCRLRPRVLTTRPAWPLASRRPSLAEPRHLQLPRAS